MKTIKKHFKSVALILSMLILFQGCTVYKSANVSLEEAYNSQTKVKVKTKDNQTLKFKTLGFENGKYFGIKKIKGEIIKPHIDESNVEKIQLKDKSTSTILTIAFPVVVIGLAIYFIVDRYSGIEMWGSGNNWY
jgi:hypothetical protein